jgi:G:T/U-mismatch repair DNA glycosylase
MPAGGAGAVVVSDVVVAIAAQPRPYQGAAGEPGSGVSRRQALLGAAAARIGPQRGQVAGARVWLLPNPSGLNAHYQLADLAAEYRTFRLALDDC